jgi:hypothetical protein
MTDLLMRVLDDSLIAGVMLIIGVLLRMDVRYFLSELLELLKFTITRDDDVA